VVDDPAAEELELLSLKLRSVLEAHCRIFQKRMRDAGERFAALRIGRTLRDVLEEVLTEGWPPKLEGEVKRARAEDEGQAEGD